MSTHFSQNTLKNTPKNTNVHDKSPYSVSIQLNKLIGNSAARDENAKITLADCLLQNETIIRTTLDHLVPYKSNYCECFSQYSKTIPLAALQGQCKGLPL